MYEIGHFKKIPLSTLCYKWLDLELAHGTTFGPTSKATSHFGLSARIILLKFVMYLTI